MLGVRRSIGTGRVVGDVRVSEWEPRPHNARFYFVTGLVEQSLGSIFSVHLLYEEFSRRIAFWSRLSPYIMGHLDIEVQDKNYY